MTDEFKDSIKELENNTIELQTRDISRYKKLRVIISKKNYYEEKYENIVNKNNTISKQCEKTLNEIEKIKTETKEIKLKLAEKHTEFFNMKVQQEALQVKYETVKIEYEKAKNDLVAIESEILNYTENYVVKHSNCDIV